MSRACRRIGWRHCWRRGGKRCRTVLENSLFRSWRCRMALEKFIDSLRVASRALAPPRILRVEGGRSDPSLATMLHTADLWLTPKAVEGFSAGDFADWPQESRSKLA